MIQSTYEYIKVPRRVHTLEKEVNETKPIECGICNEEFFDHHLSSLCACDHIYCKDCLKYYVIHKLKTQFNDIECPKEGCSERINKESHTFNELPHELKNRYEKMQKNLQELKFRSNRICPSCGSQLHMLKSQSNLFCEKCIEKYCPICLSKAHSKKGRCQDQVIRFLKRNFKYRQCKKCLFVVQKIDGCNHMSCTCGHEFCYNCGGAWNHGYHECPPLNRKPLVYRQLKRQIPERKVFNLPVVNMFSTWEEFSNERPKTTDRKRSRRIYKKIQGQTSRKKKLNPEVSLFI